MKSRKENQNEFVRNFENSTKWIYSDGSCFLCFGNFLMAVPEKAVKIICVLAGILFLADGIIKIIGYFPEIFTVWLFNLTLASEFS